MRNLFYAYNFILDSLSLLFLQYGLCRDFQMIGYPQLRGCFNGILILPAVGRNESKSVC